MGTIKKTNFIIIDDDPINNQICKRVISMVFKGADVETFTDPFKGLAHIRAAENTINSAKTILFLDINMIGLSAWEMLEQLAEAPEINLKRFIIYILSSSVADEDKEKTEKNPFTAGFIEKPLTTKGLRQLAEKW